MTQEEKEQAVDILAKKLGDQAKSVLEIEPRLFDYFSGMQMYPHLHDGYEILGGVRFLRLLNTYQFNHKKVRQVIKLREGNWEMRNGQYNYLGGGIACPGTQGATVYRWEPFQVFILASVFGFQTWINTQTLATERELLPTERVIDGMIYDLRRLCTDFTFFAPRKTDKTGLSAFIQVVFFLLEDNNAEAYCCANASD